MAKEETLPDQAIEDYDGATPFPDAALNSATVGGPLQVGVAAAITGLPFVGLIAALWLAWGHGVGPTDMLLMAGLYAFTGLGVTVGFHRCFTHRSFTAVPALRVVLAIAGSMSFQGDVIGWVATHRRHHAFSDRPGDPHSPYRHGTSIRGLLRGLVDAHCGWFFRADPTPSERYAPDLRGDRAMRAVSKAFPALSVVSLAVPFGLGWAIGGTAYSALTALLWAGLVRVMLLQHVTWSVNSLCHLLGNRPFTTRRFDRATNLWPLAVLSFGESWHNLHHSDPTCARHGVDKFQIDITAEVIRLLERVGWAGNVRWPTPGRLADRRRLTGPAADEPALVSASR